MSQRKDSLYLFILAAIAVVGLIALIGLSRPIPGELWQLGALVLGGFVGVARQDTPSNSGAQNVSLAGAIAPTVNGSNVAAQPAPFPSEGLAQDVTG